MIASAKQLSVIKTQNTQSRRSSDSGSLEDLALRQGEVFACPQCVTYTRIVLWSLCASKTTLDGE